MPSSPCRPPGPRREVITSSKMSSTPWRSAASRKAPRNSRSPSMHPPEPIIGSTRMAASSLPCRSMTASVASVSL